jgi:hypothetical protein
MLGTLKKPRRSGASLAAYLLAQFSEGDPHSQARPNPSSDENTSTAMRSAQEVLVKQSKAWIATTAVSTQRRSAIWPQRAPYDRACCDRQNQITHLILQDLQERPR